MEQHNTSRTWHKKYEETRTTGDRLADAVAATMGSWKFIIWQTAIVTMWMILNVIAYISHWDPYPFILLNLLFSTQAAYAAPIIMMSQNRQSERDRHQALADYHTNIESKEKIEKIETYLRHIDTAKLDKIITLLEKK